MSTTFQQEIEIDKTSLDTEMERIAGRIYHYGDLLAKARTAQDHLESQLKQLKALVELAYRGVVGIDVVRTLPDGFKVTDTAIKSLVDGDSEVNAVITELNSVKEDVYTLENAVNALKEKSYNIRALGELYKAGYFSTV